MERIVWAILIRPIKNDFYLMVFKYMKGNSKLSKNILLCMFKFQTKSYEVIFYSRGITGREI